MRDTFLRRVTARAIGPKRLECSEKRHIAKQTVAVHRVNPPKCHENRCALEQRDQHLTLSNATSINHASLDIYFQSIRR
jgi:hypothetical protein